MDVPVTGVFFIHTVKNMVEEGVESVTFLGRGKQATFNMQGDFH
jgi:hypothetical protein